MKTKKWKKLEGRLDGKRRKERKVEMRRIKNGQKGGRIGESGGKGERSTAGIHKMQLLHRHSLFFEIYTGWTYGATDGRTDRLMDGHDLL